MILYFLSNSEHSERNDKDSFFIPGVASLAKKCSVSIKKKNHTNSVVSYPSGNVKQLPFLHISLEISIDQRE